MLSLNEVLVDQTIYFKHNMGAVLYKSGGQGF